MQRRRKRLIFQSTCATYGIQKGCADGRKFYKCGDDPYGESKLMVERMLRWYAEIHGLGFAALRYFNACGATAERGEDHEPETHMIPIVLQVAHGATRLIWSKVATRCIRS